MSATHRKVFFCRLVGSSSVSTNATKSQRKMSRVHNVALSLALRTSSQNQTGHVSILDPPGCSLLLIAQIWETPLCRRLPEKLQVQHKVQKRRRRTHHSCKTALKIFPHLRASPPMEQTVQTNGHVCATCGAVTGYPKAQPKLKSIPFY